MKYSIKTSELHQVISEALDELDNGEILIEEPINKTDAKQIAKTEIKNFLKTSNRTEFENQIKVIVSDMIKNDNDLESHFVEIVRDVIINLYKQFWTKRQIWSNNLKR